MTDLKHILLVEDDPNEVELILAALSDNHFANRVVTVKDGEEAIEYLFCRGRHAGRATGPPAIVLLDLKLPRVDGFEVLKQLKADEKLKCLPVVILTSSSETPDIDRAYRLGAGSYIVKPIDFHQFVDVMRRIGAYWAIVAAPPMVG